MRTTPTREPRAARAGRRNASKVARRYWLTPKAWNKRCSHCGGQGAIAYRPRDHRYACERCIRKRGISARESNAWRYGGSTAGSKVTIRHVDPATLRP